MKLNFSAWTILRKYSNTMQASDGFSLVETMIGAALILVNLGVLSSALIQYGEVSKKQRVITLAMNLESALHRAVTSPPAALHYLPGAMIDQMVQPAGNFPDPYTLDFPIDIDGVVRTLSLTWPAGFTNPVDTVSVFLDRQMNTCNPDFTNMNCVILFEIAKNKIAGPSPIYSYAYRITINPDLHIGTQSLGVAEQGAFSTNRGAGNTDYKLFIPQYILASENFTLCNTTTTAGLTGYDRTTGTPICLVGPIDDVAERCDATEISKGLRVVDDGTNFHLIPRCVTARGFTCPPPNSNNDAGQIEYSMMIYDPRSLDPAFPIGVTNKCVFTAMSPAADPTPPSNVGTTLNVPQACPNPYRITTPNPYGCSASGVATASQGSCSWCSGGFNPVFPYNCLGTTTVNYNSEGNSVSGAPIMSGTDVVGANCTLTDATPFPPAAAPACTSLISPPTVTGTLTLNATCDLKPITPMIENATAE